jgi:hypothetical protein
MAGVSESSPITWFEIGKFGLFATGLISCLMYLNAMHEDISMIKQYLALKNSDFKLANKFCNNTIPPKKPKPIKSTTNVFIPWSIFIDDKYKFQANVESK